MSPINSGTLIGYGSVGHHHSQVLSARYEQMAIVDVSPKVCAQAKLDYPQATVATSLDELEAAGWDWSKSVVVIASWGTSHSADFARLVELGARHVVCEKPMADSVERAARMIELAEDNHVLLGHHLQRRYNGLVPGVRALAERFALGKPYSMFVQGGAAGIITNGIHYVDFATALFGESPQRVMSTAYGEQLNPRSKDLQLYGGSSVWSFSSDRELAVSFNNRSSLAPLTTIYYRNAFMRMAQDFVVRLHKRDEEEVERFPAVTRTGAAQETVYEGLVEGALDPQAATGRLLDEVEGSTPQTFRSGSALEVLGACIGALESGRTGSAVALPIDPSCDLGKRSWPIS